MALSDTRTSDSIDIDAPVAVVWSVYSDVERWPEWTASVTSVELSPNGPLAVGSRARIKQPRLPKVEWTVTALDAGREWVWANESPGASTVAAHSLRALDDGRTHVELWIARAISLGKFAPGARLVTSLKTASEPNRSASRSEIQPEYASVSRRR